MKVSAVAQKLIVACDTRTPIAPLTETYPGFTVHDAYSVQMAMIEERVRTGAAVVGKKIGLTSKGMQQLLGIGEPDYGHILDTMVLEGKRCNRASLIQPKVEGEIAFVLAGDLSGPGVTALDVFRNTAFVMPVIEVVDSRIRDWKIKLPDTVADNASSALVVLGDSVRGANDLDMRLTGMVMEKNGEVLATGAGAAVWGHPVAAVAWLANKLSEFGVTLKKGELVLSGAFTAAADAQLGDRFVFTFDRLGSVSLNFD
jgi:2-keto-4-pentenoate hydratase